MSMTNHPHPDRSAEAAKVRDELSHQPHAQRSLDALAREESSEADIPPIPDDLRDQWQDRYGHARLPVLEEKKSWLARFSNFWTFGTATALAALAIFFVLQSDPPAPAMPDQGPTLRGGNNFDHLETKLIVFIPSAKISFEAFAATRPVNSVLEAKNIPQAITFLTQNNIREAAVLNANSAGLSEWNGELQEGLQLIEIKTKPDTDEYDLSEALDDYLKQ